MILVTSAYAQESPASSPDAADGAAPATGELHETTEAAAEHGGGHDVFPPFDASTFGSQLFWLVITFGLLYWLMSKVAVPRIGGIIEARDNRIAGDLAAAGKAKKESEAAVAAYEQALAEARQNAHQIGGKSREAAKAEADADRARTEAALNEKLAAAEADIARVKSEALAGVDAIARDAVETMVEVLVGARVGKEAVARAVEQAMSERA